MRVRTHSSHAPITPLVRAHDLLYENQKRLRDQDLRTLTVIGGGEFEGCSLALSGDVAFVSLEMPRRW